MDFFRFSATAETFDLTKHLSQELKHYRVVNTGKIVAKGVRGGEILPNEHMNRVSEWSGLLDVQRMRHV